MLTKLNRRKSNALAAIISIAVIVIYLLDLDFGNGNSHSNQPFFNQNQTANRSGSNLHISQFDQQGMLSYQLATAQVNYFESSRPKTHLSTQKKPTQQKNFSENNEDFSLPFEQLEQQSLHSITQIKQPLITIFSGQKKTVISANIALLHDTELIELKHNVSVYESFNKNLLTTNELSLNTQLKQIMTQQSVTLSTPYSRTTAIGLQGNLADQRWQLLSEVKSEIVPK